MGVVGCPTIEDKIECVTIWVCKLTQQDRTPHLLEDGSEKVRVILGGERLGGVDAAEKLVAATVVGNLVDMFGWKVIGNPEQEGCAQRVLPLNGVELGAQ